MWAEEKFGSEGEDFSFARAQTSSHHACSRIYCAPVWRFQHSLVHKHGRQPIETASYADKIKESCSLASFTSCICIHEEISSNVLIDVTRRIRRKPQTFRKKAVPWIKRSGYCNIGMNRSEQCWAANVVESCYQHWTVLLHLIHFQQYCSMLLTSENNICSTTLLKRSSLSIVQPWAESF